MNVSCVFFFAYRATIQASAEKSPFFLYGRDPQLPIDAALFPPVEQFTIDKDDCCLHIVQEMNKAWELAWNQVQHRQKDHHDRRA